MAIIEAISSKANLKTIINYVTQDKKTSEKLITGKDCLAESSLEEMLYTKNLYNKNTGRQYIHIIQSFDPNDNLSKEKVHIAGLELAEKFNGFQVLVATHIDKEHLHNHLIINSVSFENGYKIQMSKKDLQDLKNYSDEICLKIGASVIPKKEKTNYIKRKDYRVAQRGNSWKFKLINAIDLSLERSKNKQEFIKSMNKLGYKVNWTDTRKYITYTTPEGNKCRDNKLYDEKYSKGEMENEFRRIEEEQQNSSRKSNSTISYKDELFSNKSRNTSGFMHLESTDKGRYISNKQNISRFTRKIDTRQYKGKNGIEGLHRKKFKREFLQSKEGKEYNRGRNEEENIKNKVENRSNNILGGIIAISDIFSNSQVNNTSRKIRGYKTLSKQAMKEYAIRRANASSFDWEEEM